MPKDTSWHRFFNPQKSPHTSWIINADGRLEWGYIAKHTKRLNRTGIIVWDSKRKDQFIRAIHGNLLKKRNRNEANN